MTESGYTVAWAIYLLGAVVAYGTGWWVSRSWPIWLSYPLRAITLALLVTPWPVTPDGSAMGPAWVVTAFDTFVLANGEPLRAGAALIATVVIALFLALAMCVWQYRRK